MKRILTGLLTALFIFLIPFITYIIEYTPVRANQEKVIYNLPYPGLLPDNPLYIIKAIRDNLLLLLTRDHLKKAELYLLLSDKKMAMAVMLAKKGKEKQAIDAAENAEKYFSKIPEVLKSAKKQGVSASSEFIVTLKLSNAKHREILDNFLKEFPQGTNNLLDDLIVINEQIKKSLEKL